MERAEKNGQAAGIVRHQIFFFGRAQEKDPSVEARFQNSPGQVFALRPFPDDERLNVLIFHVAKCVHEQIDPFEWLKPGHAKNKILIRVGPIISLRWRRVEDLGWNMAPAAEPLLDGSRLGKDLLDVVFQ